MRTLNLAGKNVVAILAALFLLAVAGGVLHACRTIAPVLVSQQQVVCTVENVGPDGRVELKCDPRTDGKLRGPQDASGTDDISPTIPIPGGGGTTAQPNARNRALLN